MAKFLKYSLGAGAAILAAGIIVYGTAKYHHRLQEAYQQGQIEGIDLAVGGIKTKTKDFNGDGIDDFCVKISPSSRDPLFKIICHMDYNQDCIQDTISYVLDEENHPRMINLDLGQEMSGVCTLDEHF